MSDSGEKFHGIPIYCDEKPSRVVDGSEEQSVGSWIGANDLSMRMLRCVEPVRDLTKQFELITMLPSTFRHKRVVKLLAVPLHTLAEQTLKLLNVISTDNSLNPRPCAKDRKNARKWIGWLNKAGIDKECDLATIRNKISAHSDEEAVVHPVKYWEKVNLSTFLEWAHLLGVVLIHVLGLKGIYGWSKLDSPDGIWELMNVDGTVVHLHHEDGKVDMITAITLAESPKLAIFREIQSLRHASWKLMQQCSIPPAGGSEADLPAVI